MRLLLEWYREARRAPEVIVVPDLPPTPVGGRGMDDVAQAHAAHVRETVALTMKAITGFRPVVTVLKD